jgi:hypothetical protein
VARPRKPQRGSAKPAPRSERTARDNAKAKRLGYKSYYDYRLHASGQLPPRFAIAPFEVPYLRGHKGGYAGRIRFLVSLGEGDLIIMPSGVSATEFDEGARKGVGAYLEIVKLVIDGETGADRTYILRNLTRDELIDTIEEEQRRGAIFSPQPSLDQRRLVAEREAEGGY